MNYSCPRCKTQLEISDSWAGTPCKTWYECPKCNTYLHTYQPLPHQRAVHEDPHTTIGNFGGYGTGKTTTSREEIVKHILLTPDALIVIGASVQRQYEQTLKRDLEMDIPRAFVKHYSVQKQTMDFINGARIMWSPFDDPGKLRSLNITMYVMLEASEIKYDIYTQLDTRLRNMAAGVPKRDANGRVVYDEHNIPVMEYDWRKGIVESNPDSGWIRNDVLLRSHRIYQHGIYHEYYQDDDQIIKSVSSHVSATKVNPYLPKGWEDNLRAKNPEWWVKRFLEGSFQYSEGLVYPSAAAHIVPYFDIPRNWKRIVAFDYGLSDKAAFVYGAIDEVGGKVYIYRVLTATNKSLEELARMYHRGAADIPHGGLYTSPIIDPKSGPKRDYNKRSLADQFLDYGINFQPGAVDVDARVYRLNTYLEQGRLKILDVCGDLIDEILEYRFEYRVPPGSSKQIAKPMDKNNHAINALEWIVMELPRDPRRLVDSLYTPTRNDPYEEKGAQLPWQFTDKEEEEQQGGPIWW